MAEAAGVEVKPGQSAGVCGFQKERSTARQNRVYVETIFGTPTPPCDGTGFRRFFFEDVGVSPPDGRRLTCFLASTLQMWCPDALNFLIFKRQLFSLI